MRLAGMTALALALASAWVGCELGPLGAPPPRGGTAQTLGMFSTELPSDMDTQALAALERDAWRRHHRFLDAIDPGHLVRATAVPEEELSAGQWTPEEIFELGGQLFNTTFTRENGYGAADLQRLSRVHVGRRGGPDAMSCATCHWRGGPAGAGDGADSAYLDGDGDVQASALARNPIALHGAGLVEILAVEMNRDLAQQKDFLVAHAKLVGAPQRAKLASKGVSFGELVARPDGQIDVTDVEGLDPDLIIKPFGWKGNIASVRDAVEEALMIHHGMQTSRLARTGPPDLVGPFGAPDPDGDGVVDEIGEGQLTALTLFVAMQEVPESSLPSDQDQVLVWAKGQAQFAALGCASCHVPSLGLESTRFTLPSREERGPMTVDLAEHGAEPRIAKAADGSGYRVALFSDLKRHDMGAALAEAHPHRGTLVSHFLTRPLWGLARSRPYLHDARAPTIEDAILLHGGEAQAARDDFAALSEPERASIRVYLTSLTRARRMIAP
jgi:hypothetical protein